MNRSGRNLVVLLLVAFSGAQSAPPDCTCAASKLKGGWCKVCRVGHLASIKIESEMLFENLDAHGHDIDPSRLQCEVCKKAIKTDGYCDACRMGFVRGLAYLSRLTYHLARGVARDVPAIQCATCRNNAVHFGWCDLCKVGMIGNVTIAEKGDFERAVPEFQRLLEARKMMKTCEMCAVALFADGYCLTCKKSYLGGKVVSAAP